MSSRTTQPNATIVPADPKSAAEAILAKAQSSRTVIQDFVPLAESLEWQLGQEYLRQRGNKAFLSDASPVPFVINNDGTLSRKAAKLFFDSLVESENNAPLVQELFVLELGIGVGLFARFFLDHFRDLCHEHNKDYYDRLCYIAADRSERMLLDVCRHGVLAHHPGRYRLRLIDAMEPAKNLPHDAMFCNHPGKPLRAVFLNYLLDCLPAAVLEFGEASESVKQLCVRTCVARNVKLEDYTDLSADGLAHRAKLNDAASQRELLEVYGLFASEYDYRPVDVKTLPLGDFALQIGRTKKKKLLHSYGAIQSLERLLDLVHEDGFILVNDYGQTVTVVRDEVEHQRFSMATFVGVNFSLLKAYFQEGNRCQYRKPFGESGSIHSRLLAHKLSKNLRLRFSVHFGEAMAEHLHEPAARARQCLHVGRFELASSYYQQALARQPSNWVLLSEVAQFLIFSLRDVKAGIDLAKVALALNPTCSAELWNVLGDGLFEFGRYAEARSAYLRALEVNGSDVRARYNLAWVYQREKNFPAALEKIAEALTLDKMGQYRERLLQKQNELVAQQVQRHQTEYLLLVNLVSKYASPSPQDPPKVNAEAPSSQTA
ncbi:MAG TPA: tetratricopeptide repeat protein [Gemmataceae bacterium]|nr:tetratricopeptide repeat protein [Gemmataceae bacterium]